MTVKEFITFYNLLYINTRHTLYVKEDLKEPMPVLLNSLDKEYSNYKIKSVVFNTHTNVLNANDIFTYTENNLEDVTVELPDNSYYISTDIIVVLERK